MNSGVSGLAAGTDCQEIEVCTNFFISGLESFGKGCARLFIRVYKRLS